MIGSTATTVLAAAGGTRAVAAAGETPSVTVTGGPPLLVFAVFALLVVATGLSLLITYKLLRGYRRSGSRRLLALAVGLFLLTAAPMVVRVAFATSVDPSLRVLSSSATQLAGLFAILYAIYR